MGDLLQAARANAVHAFLVLLDLLKGQAKAISQVGLTELEHQASHADAAADLLVDQDGRLLSAPMHRMLIRPRFDDHGQADYFGINHPFGA
jgi:predicted metal-dependent HD superfamily phosphohydrolase